MAGTARATMNDPSAPIRACPWPCSLRAFWARATTVAAGRSRPTRASTLSRSAMAERHVGIVPRPVREVCRVEGVGGHDDAHHPPDAAVDGGDAVHAHRQRPRAGDDLHRVGPDLDGLALGGIEHDADGLRPDHGGCLIRLEPDPHDDPLLVGGVEQRARRRQQLSGGR